MERRDHRQTIAESDQGGSLLGWSELRCVRLDDKDVGDVRELRASHLAEAWTEIDHVDLIKHCKIHVLGHEKHVFARPPAQIHPDFRLLETTGARSQERLAPPQEFAAERVVLLRLRPIELLEPRSVVA